MYYSLTCHSKHNQTYEPEAAPFVPAGFLQIEVVKAAICGSDLMVFNQTHPYKQYPAILGHEFIGKIADSAGNSAFRQGQWVTGLSFGFCGNCVSCEQGMSNHCLNKVTYNTAGTSGAFTRTMIAHHSSLLPLPEDTAIVDEYVLSEPLSIIVHAMRKATFFSKARVVIIGAGAMGILSAIYCREEMGIASLTLIDNTASRREFVRSLGFDSEETLAGREPDSIDILIIAGGHKLDINNYIASLRPAAQVLLISYFDSESTIDMNILVRKEITLRGSFLSDKRDLATAINILGQAIKKESALKKVITDVIAFSELRDFMLNKNSKGKVLINEPGVLP